jgi:propanol-preferring alcohol dehydrogenase
MQEAICFALDGKVKATIHTSKQEDIKTVFDEMKKVKLKVALFCE